jgi:hypothetical protein
VKSGRGNASTRQRGKLPIVNGVILDCNLFIGRRFYVRAFVQCIFG